MKKGLIHLYIGDGKGKTTASVGLATRASGYGKSVVFAQFLKGRSTGETIPLKKLGALIIRSDKDMGFCRDMDDGQRRIFRAEQERILAEVKGAVSDRDKTDLLILDEALNAIEIEMLDENALKEFILQKPEHIEIVLTGRKAPDWLIETADYVTEMKKIKHPYDRGVGGRPSIEY
jgi:cob(I)alamin adenosyltransferase